MDDRRNNIDNRGDKIGSKEALDLWNKAKRDGVPISYREAARRNGVTDAALHGYIARKEKRKLKRLEKIKASLLIEDVIICQQCLEATEHILKTDKDVLLFSCKICGTEVSEQDVEMT